MNSFWIIYFYVFKHCTCHLKLNSICDTLFKRGTSRFIVLLSESLSNASPHIHARTPTRTWPPLWLGASSDVDDGLVRCLGVVGPERGDADALGQPELAVALLDHLDLPGPLEQKHPVHSHPRGLTHHVEAAGGKLAQGLRALWGSASSQLSLKHTF